MVCVLSEAVGNYMYIHAIKHETCCGKLANFAYLSIIDEAKSEIVF